LTTRGKQRPLVIGGGHGLPILIKSLRRLGLSINAISTVADDGGSSGVLREELKIPPPGDCRNSLVALAQEKKLAQMFQYRFISGNGFKGHALGNLVLAALTEKTGRFCLALKEAAELLQADGSVFPASDLPLTLVAEVEKGVVVGQCNVANRLWPLKKIKVLPESAPACEEAVKAIEQAKVIIFGPGSLYTSIIANLLVKDIKQAVLASKAKKIFLCNLAVQPGETDGYQATDHLNAFFQHVAPNIVDVIVTSNTKLSKAARQRLRAGKSDVVKADVKALSGWPVQHFSYDLTNTACPTRHDELKLSKALSQLFQELNVIL